MRLEEGFEGGLAAEADEVVDEGHEDGRVLESVYLIYFDSASRYKNYATDHNN